MELLISRKEGIYCPPGDFYIDPHTSVRKALVTHAHSDHARPGSQAYLTADSGLELLRYRLGKKTLVEGIPYGSSVRIGGVNVQFFPAGHILGSSQIRLEFKGEVWVVSGDYKTNPDPTCTPWETLPCHVFLTESTFALPIYQWLSEEDLCIRLNEFFARNAYEKQTTILFAYSLGKTQRLLSYLDPSIGPIFLQDASYSISKIYESQGVSFPKFLPLSEYSKQIRNACILMAPGGNPFEYFQNFGEFRSAFASGWNQKEALDFPSYEKLVVSDHSDWKGLNQTVLETGAETVYIHHGFVEPWVEYLLGIGINARAFTRNQQ